MTKPSFTSKCLIGEPVEPKLIKFMMKTKIFKTSHQAGMTLIIFSAICWIIVVILGVSFFMKQQHLSTELELTKEAISQIDPILFEGIFEPETPVTEGDETALPDEENELSSEEVTEETQPEITPEEDLGTTEETE